MIQLLALGILYFFSSVTADCPEMCRCNKYKAVCRNSNLYGLPYGLYNSTEYLRVQDDNIAQLNQKIVSDALPTKLKELQLVNVVLRRIEKFTFENMKFLELLVIKDNNINTLVAGTFRGLHMVYKLDLSQNRIFSLEPGVFEGLNFLRHLNMSNNHIERLNLGIFNAVKTIERFHLVKLRSILDFSFNKIEYIEGGVFRNLSTFTKLHLEGCNAVPFIAGMFEGLAGLSSLHMTNRISHRNNHTTLTKDILQDISNLTILNFRNSSISSIQVLAFQDFNLLSQLDLSLNLIYTIQKGIFSGLSSLKVLVLSRNNIRLLDNNVFEDLNSLRMLNLSQCRINIIHSNAFKGLSKLKFLDLSDNNLSRLISFVFSDLTELREIILRGNNIVNLQSLNNLVSIKQLNLQNTGLNNIEGKVFRNLRRLDSLKISNVDTIEGQEVLRILDVHINMEGERNSNVGGKLRKILQDIQYLPEFRLSISGINSTSQVGDISEYRFTFIDLSHNRLPMFIDNFLKNQTSLKSMKIRNCGITTIEVGVFQDLMYLIDLDLSYNSEIKLRPGIFLGMENLNLLNLSFCEMDTIDAGVFFGLDNLQLLDISENEISTLYAGIFDGLNSIITLNMSHNRISVLGIGVFGNVCSENFNTTSEVFYMSCAFRSLVTLQILDLSHNEISNIDSQAFSNCIALEKLHLNNNEMLQLDSKFLQAPSLKILILRNCNVTNIPPDMFKNITRLEEIDLSFNDIQDINLTETFDHLLNLQKINFSGNPMPCNCEYREMWQWLQDRYLVNRKTDKFYFLEDSICNYSSESLISIMNCNDSTRINYFREYDTPNLTFFHRNINPIILTMVFVSALLGNSFLIYAIIANYQLRWHTKICIFGLATANLFFLVLYMSLNYWDTHQNTSPLNSLTGMLIMTIKDLVVGITAFSMLVMSMQNCIVLIPLTKSSLQYRYYQTKTTLLLNLLAWGLAFLTVIPIHLSSKNDMNSLKSSENNIYLKRIETSKLLTYCIVPIFAIVSIEVFNYIVLLESVRRLLFESVGISKPRETKPFLNLTIILAFVFIVSYSPNFIMKVLVVCSVVDSSNLYSLLTLFSYLFFSYSVMYPIVLFTAVPEYKYTLMKLFQFRVEFNSGSCR